MQIILATNNVFPKLIVFLVIIRKGLIFCIYFSAINPIPIYFGVGKTWISNQHLEYHIYVFLGAGYESEFLHSLIIISTTPDFVIKQPFSSAPNDCSSMANRIDIVAKVKF